MGSRGLERALRRARAWPVGRSGPVGDYEGFERRRLRRKWAIASAAILGSLAVGAGGYAVGAAQVSDADSAQQVGTIAGERGGTALGAFEGYAHAFRPAREHAYDAAYREAYATAYVHEFEKADVPAPDDVKVSGP